MKIISWNVNGVRAVERKGELENILSTPNLDFLFIQEIKSKPENLSEIEEKYSKDWIISWHSAENQAMQEQEFSFAELRISKI